MSSKKPESPIEDSDDEIPEEGPPTESLADTPVEVTETESFTHEGTEILDSKEDVLVLLPEGAEGDIPVVETEVVEEEAGEHSDDHTDILKQVPIEDVPLKRTNPLSGEPDEPEAPAVDNLEDLASQVDEDEFLSPQEEPVEPKKRARVRSSHEDSPRSGIPQFFPSVKDEGSSGPEFHWKVPLALAAVLAIAATAYFTYPQWKHVIQGELTALTGGTSAGVPVDAGTQPGVKEGPKVIAKASGGVAKAAVPEELARASKEAFREKFLLSVELGYVGEVSNE